MSAATKTKMPTRTTAAALRLAADQVGEAEAQAAGKTNDITEIPAVIVTLKRLIRLSRHHRRRAITEAVRAITAVRAAKIGATEASILEVLGVDMIEHMDDFLPDWRDALTGHTDAAAADPVGDLVAAVEKWHRYAAAGRTAESLRAGYRDGARRAMFSRADPQVKEVAADVLRAARKAPEGEIRDLPPIPDPSITLKAIDSFNAEYATVCAASTRKHPKDKVAALKDQLAWIRDTIDGCDKTIASSDAARTQLALSLRLYDRVTYGLARACGWGSNSSLADMLSKNGWRAGMTDEEMVALAKERGVVHVPYEEAVVKLAEAAARWVRASVRRREAVACRAELFRQLSAAGVLHKEIMEVSGVSTVVLWRIVGNVHRPNMPSKKRKEQVPA